MNRRIRVTAATVLTVAALFVLLRTLAARPVSAQTGTSVEAAAILESKIEAIRKAEKTNNSTRPAKTVEVSEVELESYVLDGLRDDIPARVDSIDVQLTDGAVAADTKMTFGPESTGNPMVDVLIAGTHTLFIKGKLAATATVGKFELEEVKVDGIPVPTVLIETLIARYVKPKYPEVDLKEPFTMPWGIETLTITHGKTTIVY